MQWLRLYYEALDDPKVQRLNGDTFKAWVNLLLLAGRTEKDGALPSLEDMAFALRLDEGTMADTLLVLGRVGLLDRDGDNYAIHNYRGRQFRSDDTTDRVTKWRKAKRLASSPTVTPQEGVTVHETLQRNTTVTPTVTPPETETETETETEQTQNRVAPAEQPSVRVDSVSAVSGLPTLALDSPTPKPSRESCLTKRQQVEFDSWWSTYPHKVEKKQAEAAWKVVNADGSRTEEIVTGTAAQRLHEREVRFVPHPHRFLKNQRWRDEPPLVQSHTPSSNARPGPVDNANEAIRRIYARDEPESQSNRVYEAKFTRRVL